MLLRYIGVNGSMGLVKGRTYIVKIFSKDGRIWAEIWIDDRKFKETCPYDSPQSLARNWEAVGD